MVAIDNSADLREHNPTNLPDLGDRDLDNWIPLIAIADLAGGDGPDMARLSAKQLCGESVEESNGIEPLKDVRQIFAGYPGVEGFDKPRDAYFSAGLVNGLTKLEGRPWVDYNKGNGLTQNQLARMLKGFGVYPRNIRIDDKVKRGYEAVQGNL